MTLFIIILSYQVDLETIDQWRFQHLEFLDDQYKNEVFIASGPKVPRTGGIIIAKASSKEVLNSIIEKDPFYIQKLAKYDIHEFMPTKFNLDFFHII